MRRPAAGLLIEVERAFEVTGATTPGWPDPHPDLRPPLEEEYSRVSDPGRYRILQTRIEAWVEVLAARGLATSRDEARGKWVGAGDLPLRAERVLRIDPVRAAGLSLLVVGTVVDGAPYGFELGVTGGDAPPVLVGRLPVCGCDACDDGSSHLLGELDDHVLRAMRGGVVHTLEEHDVDGPETVTEYRWRGGPWL